MRVLYITANPKNIEDSTSLTVGKAFVDAYKKANPKDEILHLNLYKQNITPLNLDDLKSMGNPESKLQKIAKEFASFDKYIIATPMWNLGLPSILKSYIDTIMIPNILFKYGAHGIPHGLLNNKKAFFIIARGGWYSLWPLSKMAHDERYLKTIFNFIGIKDIKSLKVQKTEMNRNKIEQIRAQAVAKAQRLAKNF